MKKIVIAGLGPGSAEYLTPAACAAVERATVLIGTKRLLDLFPSSQAEKISVGVGIDQVLDIAASKRDSETIVFVVTGDPGIFSLAKRVIQRFGRDACDVVPGVSSVQVAFAGLGLDWADARIISAHKENPDESEWSRLESCDKIAFFAGRKGALVWLADAVNKLKGPRRVFVCEDLTLPTERIFETTPADLATLDVSSRVIILILGNDVWQ